MSRASERVQWRFRLVTCCLAFVALSFIQSPGRIATDTKLDLVVDPGSFLERALSFWDPQSAFGQVQNQAYGYLFPMGPFFWSGHELGLDPWVIQRLWWSLLLSLAFLGMVKLCSELGVRSDFARVLAGFVFALSPRILTGIGPSSIEVWPSAIAPWVLIPLVIGMERGSPRRQAALSAIAVAFVGGVNAAATFAVIPLGAVWLMMSKPGPRRRQLMLWWPGLVLLGTLWWLVPLFLLGSYSPPFLDFIESSSVTTVAATPFDALRGTTNWVPYISSNSISGKELLSSPYLILNGGIVLVLGLVGLSRRSTPHRRYLFVALLTGMLVLTAGHSGAFTGLAQEPLQQALDSVLAPLRNTHKFDVLVRIPLVVGFAHAASAALGSRPVAITEMRDRPAATRVIGFGLFLVAAVAGATAPAWSGQLANRGTFDDLPAYWHQASQWIDKNSTGTSLLEPASAFPEYVWGNSGDEPMQPLSSSPWSVRNSVPLSASGNIRFLDSVSGVLGTGEGSDGLATTLRRAGVEFLVVRNDLRADIATGRTEIAYRTLEGSSGLTSVASFGPNLGGSPNIDLGSERSFSNGGWQSSHPAVEIFKVSGSTQASFQTRGSTPTVLGGPESLSTLDSWNLLPQGPVLLAQDQPAELNPSTVFATDGLRRREAAFGSVYGNYSASMARDEKFEQTRKVHDYLEPDSQPWLATPSLKGASSLVASSSRSEVSNPGGTRPSQQPWSAFDNDERTSWTAQESEGWIRLNLDSPRDLGDVTIRANLAPGQSADLEVETERGLERIEARGSQPIVVNLGTVNRIFLRGNTDAGDLSISEIAAPVLELSRPLALPVQPMEWKTPEAWVFGDDGDERPACLEVLGIDRCRYDEEEAGEDAYLIDRKFNSPTESDYRIRLKVGPVGGVASERLLQKGMDVGVESSSNVNSDVRSGPSRVVDRDLKTGWISRPDDVDPSLIMTWGAPKRLQRLHVVAYPDLPATPPTQAILEFDNGTQQRVDLEDGFGAFEPVDSKRVTVRLSSKTPARDSGADGFAEVLPIGVSEIWFEDIPRESIRTSESPIVMPCGSGPDVVVGSMTFQTSVHTSTADIADGRSAEALSCDDSKVTFIEGANRVRVRASEMFRIKSVEFGQDGDPTADAAPVPTKDVSPTERSFDLGNDHGEGFVFTGQNINRGWKASASDEQLNAVRINGWQQGWYVPIGVSGTLTQKFAPNQAYQWAMGVGAVGFMLLIAASLIRGRERSFGDGRARSNHPIVLAIAFVGTLAVVGGGGLVACAAVGAVAAAILAWRFGRPEIVIAVAMLVPIVYYLATPWGNGPTWAGERAIPQGFVGVALGALCFTVIADFRSLRRKKGVST